MIEVKNLTKNYGLKRAVDNISFTVNDGEILGFLGPNGAGKSTTMNILTGYLSSTQGEVKIDGIDILEEPMKAKKKIGYLPEQPPLYLDMTVMGYLNFMYDLKKCKLPRKSHLQEICNLVKITEVSGRLIRNLSKGYRQRVGLAQALVGNPDVLVLDEPTVGLDPKQIIEIRNLIKKLGKRHTLILSSHILSEVQATCDRVIIINNGVLVADDTTSNLSHKMNSDNRFTLRVDAPEKEAFKVISSIPGMVRVDSLGQKEPGSCDFVFETDEDVDVRRELFARMAERNWPILGLRSSELSLEEIFLRLTKDDSVTPMTPQKQVEVKQTVAKILGDNLQPETEQVFESAPAVEQAVSQALEQMAQGPAAPAEAAEGESAESQAPSDGADENDAPEDAGENDGGDR